MNANLPPAPAQSASNSPLHLPDLLVGAATVPLLLGLVAAKVLSKATQELGLLSEEVFRGDRLPILPGPNATHPLDHTPTQPSDPD